MGNFPVRDINDNWIISKRGKKNKVDPTIPYAFLHENEFTHNHRVEEVATIFLTNKECPFHCLMCDLWKNTTDKTVSLGAIPGQIKYALERLPKAKHLKLYNSGNFFDSKAIPFADYPAISELVSSFETLIVESHPKFITQRCLDFSRSIKPDLQVALGLETVHPEILPLLNKQMTLNEYKKAVQVLNENNILTRTFILLGLPFLNEQKSVYWAKKSVEFAFQAGVECCSVIPTRSGNGAMNYIMKKGEFVEPHISALHEVLEFGLNLKAGRVFADLWDIDHFSRGERDFAEIKAELERMNLEQKT